MSKFLWVLLFLMMVVASACNPQSPSAEPPAATLDPDQPVSSDDTPQPAIEPTPRQGEWLYGEAVVESIELLTLESFPLQIHAIVRGVLGDGCTELDEITTTREGDAFKITIMTARPADAVCTQIAQGFEQVVPLDVYGLEAGTYGVEANSVTSSFTLAQDNILADPE